MKRTERHHLKENEIQILARQVRQTLELRRREVTAATIIAAVVAAAAAGYFAWRHRVEGKAHALLADALAVQEARIIPAGPATGTAAAAQTSGTFATERATKPASALPVWTNSRAWRTDSAWASLGVTVDNPDLSRTCFAAKP